MRKFLVLLLPAAALLVNDALGQTARSAPTAYPAKSVRIVVGFAPGGGVDVIARFVAQKLTESFGQSFIVDNHPGATGNIAAEQVAKAAPDGHMLLMTSTVHAVNATMFSKLPFDPIKDFAGVSTVAAAPDCIAVHPSMPARSVAELIRMAKADANALSYASAGTGTIMHIGMELFRSMAAIRILHVPYNGSGPSTIAVIGGQVPVLSTSLGTALPYARAGKLRMLAVTSAERTQLAPDFPTVAEAAPLPGYEAITWIGLLAPGGTPAAVVEKLSGEIGRQLMLPEVRKQLAGQAWDAYFHPGSEFADMLKSDIVKWGRVVRELGATAS